MMKFASSPTPLVPDTGRCITFLSSSTITPQTGPSANDVMTAGRSEKSNFRNDGTIGMLNSRNISTAEIADIIAVTVIFLMLITLFSIVVSPQKINFSRGKKKSPRGDKDIFSLPDFTVGTGISPVRLSLVDFTTGMEFHQSPKIYI